jgi:hypothetical protein
MHFTKNKKCPGWQKSRQKTVDMLNKYIRICVLKNVFIFFDWAPWTCRHPTLPFSSHLFYTNFSVDEMKSTRGQY